MAKKKRQTQNQRLYAKQLKRVKQFIRRAEKRGYEFSENVLPDKPKRITQKSIKALQNLTPDKLYSKARYIDYDTGEILTGKEGRKAERKASALKGAETRKRRLAEPTQEPTNTPGFYVPENINEDETFFDYVVISQWYSALGEFANGEAYNLLRSWMGSLVRTEGKHNVAQMLQDGAENGHILSWEVVYKSDNAVLYIGYMLDYLPDEGVIFKEETLDRMEYMKRLGDALEQDEDWEYPL